MSIAVLTPSRQRPAALAEMLKAINDTRTEMVHVYVGLDDDDAPNYASVVKEYAGFGVRFIPGSRQQLAGWTNTLLNNALEDGHDIIASFGDDHRPRTPGWDARVAAAFSAMGSGLVYTRDGLQDERLPTAPFWSADVLRALGWFFPPPMKHLYCDDAWLAMAQGAGCCAYLPDVLIEHLHPSATGDEPDAINQENDSFYERDRQAFDVFCRDMLPSAVARIRALR